MDWRAAALALAAWSMFGAAPAMAGSVTAIVENDSFFDHSDRHYTNGLYVSWTSDAGDDDAALADTLLLMPQVDEKTGGGVPAYRHGFFFGQSIFTPANLSLQTPDPKDRPYAGWLYAGARLWRDDGDTLDRVEGTFGVVGPMAGADAVQKWWHAANLAGGVKPLGWAHQQRDEPGLVLGEQRIWRLRANVWGLETEALPQVSFAVGNVFDYAAAGAMVRVGGNLDADWGPARIQPGLDGADFASPAGFAWYVFAGFEGRAVARNMFLDGNSFASGPRVGHLPGVADLNAGAAVLWRGVRMQAVYTERTAEFRGQDGRDRFLAINLSVAD